MKSIRGYLIFLLMCFAAAVPLFSEIVYLDELQSAGDADSIVFRNYSGPHSKIDTIEEIRGIGRVLGEKIGATASEFSFYGKYRVIHAVSLTETEGLNADIFILEPSAAVDHIDNLRRIIAGYLEQAYEYSTDRADLLAEFITVYNAVYRQNLEYFEGVYNSGVLKHLVKEKAGLALSYDQWPGQTMMVIPLTPEAGTGTLADLDTDILSDEEVIDQLRTEEDMGIESRQAMVDLKDDEVLEQRQDLEKQQQALEEKEKKLDEKETALDRESRELAEDNPEDAKRLDEIEEEKAQISEQKQEIAEAEAEIEKKEAEIEKREEKIVEERDSISEDQMTVINRDTAAKEESPAAPVQKAVKTIPFLKLEESGGLLTGRLLLIDPQDGKIIRQSDVDTIRIRGYRYIGKEIISVAGSTGGDRTISLVAIDPESLEITRSGTVEVYTNSAVAEVSGRYYAAVEDGGDWKAGIFDKDFKLTSVSKQSIFPATEFVINNGNVIVQDAAGRIVTLTPEDFAAK